MTDMEALTKLDAALDTIIEQQLVALEAVLECDRTYDAIVVGSGISGGWAARELGQKGLKMGVGYVRRASAAPAIS